MPLNAGFDRQKSIPVLDTDFATLWCYPEVGIVHHQVKRWMEKQGEELQRLLQAGLEQMQVHHCTAWLSDDRNSGGMRSDTEAWAKTVWHPQMVEAGWKRWAIVLPERAISQLSLERFARDYREIGIDVDLFGNPEDAFNWLCKP